MQDDNQYTPFYTYPLSSELRLFIEQLAVARARRPEQIKCLLDQARANLQVARLFNKSGVAGRENIRYWTEQCAADTMRAVLWLEIGSTPRKEPTNRNAEILVEMGLVPGGLCLRDWSSPCETLESMGARLAAAGRLLKFGYDRLAAKFPQP